MGDLSDGLGALLRPSGVLPGREDGPSSPLLRVLPPRPAGVRRGSPTLHASAIPPADGLASGSSAGIGTGPSAPPLSQGRPSGPSSTLNPRSLRSQNAVSSRHARQDHEARHRLGLEYLDFFGHHGHEQSRARRKRCPLGSLSPVRRQVGPRVGGRAPERPGQTLVSLLKKV